MSRKVYVAGKAVTVDPRKLIGTGGEAEVYSIAGKRVLKLFKGPDHPEVKGSKTEREAAERRLEEHQKKLRAFPAGLPPEVVVPAELATDRRKKKVLGYVMRRVPDPEHLLRYAEPAFRRAGVGSAEVVELFRKMHGVLRGLHQQDVVVGDLNDMNVLVSGGTPWFIDADSYQFGGFPSRVFTERYVDPLVCDPKLPSPILARPYTWEADWYAYAVLLMRSLLCVGPYGGIYRPADKSKRLKHGQRPMKRITVFHPEVRYPKPAFPLESLSDELAHHFVRVFQEDLRGLFPLALLEDLHFQRCKACKLEHARTMCPRCAPGGPVQRTPQMKVRGEVTAEVLFRSEGVIVAAAVHDDTLRVVHHEAGAYRREDGSVLFESPRDPRLRFHIQGRKVIAARGRELVVLEKGEEPARTPCDLDGERPAVCASARHRYWVADGALYRDEPGLLGRVRIGSVLQDRTRIWVGPRFGLGLYRIGRMNVGFVFDAENPGLNDGLELPPLPGELIGASCALDEERAWLTLAHRHRGRIRHLVRVYTRSGELVAGHEADADDGSWAGHLGGELATGGHLFVAGDLGLERVETIGGQGLAVTRSFPDTEPFVDSASGLAVGPRGLYRIGEDTITALRLGG